MHVYVAGVRKLVYSHTYYVTVSQAPTNVKAVITVAPLKFRWGRHVDIAKYIGSSVVKGSAKIIIPKHVVEYLSLMTGDHVWIRVARYEPGVDPVLPPVPYIFEERRSKNYILVARRYMEALAEPIQWNGRVYVKFWGTKASLVAEPTLVGDSYAVPIPPELRPWEGKVLIAPLTDAVEKRVRERGTLPGFPS